MSLQTREAALTTPIFIKGTTQFIVEFAGDFFEQTPGEPLGVPDYDVIAAGETRMRWYGVDRDMDGDGTVTVGAGDVTTLTAHEGTSGTARRYNGNAAGVFEHPNATVPGAATVWAWKAAAPIGGAGAPPVGGDPTVPTAGTPGDWQYVRPSYIRITIEILDPNGRLNDGQRIELIYPIKAVTQ
jgi:hypothetical protein